jgi:hypothetical protein
MAFLSHRTPPSANRIDRKAGGVMIGAHADPSDIVGDVIDAVWNSAAQFGIDTPVGGASFGFTLPRLGSIRRSGEPASVSHSLANPALPQTVRGYSRPWTWHCRSNGNPEKPVAMISTARSASSSDRTCIESMIARAAFVVGCSRTSNGPRSSASAS